MFRQGSRSKTAFFITLGLMAAITTGWALHMMRCPNPLPRLLQLLPIPSTLLGPPKGWITAEGYRTKHPDQYITIIPAHDCIHAPFPLAANAREEVRTIFPEAFVLTIDGGRVYGKNGVVITDEDQVLADTAIEWISSVDKHSIFRKNKFRPITYVDKTVAVIASTSAHCYFHWMFDVLPRLELLQRSQIPYDKIYLNPLQHPFQKESFARLGIDPEKVIWATRSAHIKAKKLIVPSLAAGRVGSDLPAWAVPRWACDFAKSIVGAQVPPVTNKRIYISRKQAATRTIVNESECLAALKRRGFEEVVLEKLSLQEQAELFASAECIVAPHGAGLTNLIFCRPGIRVIEIFSPHYVNTCYWMLSHQLELKHQCLFGTQEGLSKESQLKNDVYIPVGTILNAIDVSLL